MKYYQLVTSTLDHGRKNLIGLVVFSVALTLTVVPLVITLLVGGSLAVLGGLWATCLLFGFAVVATFHFTVAAAKRGVSIKVWPCFRMAAKRSRVGFELGVVTFVVVVGVMALVTFTPTAYRSFAVGSASFLLVSWYTLVCFAAVELGNGKRLLAALRSSSVRILQSPLATAWFVLLSFACMLIAGITVITMVVLLPGVLGLLAANIVAAVDSTRNISQK